VIVEVQLEETSTVWLAEIDDLTRFSVRVRSDCGIDAVDEMLRSWSVGWIDGAEAMIRVDAIQRLVGPTTDAWAREFTRMVAAAKDHGWTDGTGSAIRGHIVRDRPAVPD